MHNRPVLSVIIASRSKPAYLAAVLQALDREREHIGAPVEVIVILDSEDPEKLRYESVLLLRSTDALNVTLSTRGGSRSVQRNCGLRAAKSAVLLLLDDDCVPAPGVLAAHIASHDEGPSHFAVSHIFALSEASSEPILLDPNFKLSDLPSNSSTRISRMALAAEQRWGRRLLEPPLPAWILFVTRCVSFRAENAIRFDESYRGWGIEDWDFGRRLYTRGVHARVLPGPPLWHLAHPESPNRTLDLVRNLRHFLRLHPYPDVALAVRFDPRALALGEDAVLRFGDVSFTDLIELTGVYAQQESGERLLTAVRWRLQAEFCLAIRMRIERARRDVRGDPDYVQSNAKRGA